MQFLLDSHDDSRLRSTLLDDLDLVVQELCAMLLADDTTPLFFVNIGVPDFEAPEFEVPTY
jgi:hypothetical protein